MEGEGTKTSPAATEKPFLRQPYAGWLRTVTDNKLCVNLYAKCLVLIQNIIQEIFMFYFFVFVDLRTKPQQ